jgi:hypothetical protein
MRKAAIFISVVLGTAIIGIILGILGAVIGANLLEDGFAGWGGLVGAIMGMSIGYPIGVFAGLITINKLFHYPGSLLIGLIGVILGGVTPFLLAELSGVNLNADLLWVLILLSPPVLGAIGYHLKVK